MSAPLSTWLLCARAPAALRQTKGRCVCPPLSQLSANSVFPLAGTHSRGAALLRHPALPCTSAPLTALLRSILAAACRYELTVGHLEPSYVIQRFLDVQRLNALTRYLERLHSQVC